MHVSAWLLLWAALWLFAGVAAHTPKVDAISCAWRLITEESVVEGVRFVVRAPGGIRFRVGDSSAHLAPEDALADPALLDGSLRLQCGDSALALRPHCDQSESARIHCASLHDPLNPAHQQLSLHWYQDAHCIVQLIMLLSNRDADAANLDLLHVRGRHAPPLSGNCTLTLLRSRHGMWIDAAGSSLLETVLFTPAAPQTFEFAAPLPRAAGKRPGRRKGDARPAAAEPEHRFVDAEFASFFAESMTLGSETAVTRMDKAIELGWRLARLQRQQALADELGDGQGAEAAQQDAAALWAQARGRSPSAAAAVERAGSGTLAASAGTRADSMDSVLLELRDYTSAGDTVGVSTGFIIMALVEGFAPKAIKKATEKLSNIFETKLIPMVEDQLGGSPKPVPAGKGGGKGTSKLADGPGALATGISRDLLQSTPLIVKGIADIFASLMSLDLHNALVAKLRDPLRDSVTHALDLVLTGGLAIGVREIVPTVLERLLPPLLISGAHKALTNVLTRAVTHSLSATLMHTLRDGPRTQVDCWYCQYRGERCEQCWPGDPERQGRHFASLYADRDAAFYSDYYAAQFLAPPGEGEAAGAGAGGAARGGSTAAGGSKAKR